MYWARTTLYNIVYNHFGNFKYKIKKQLFTKVLNDYVQDCCNESNI